MSKISRDNKKKEAVKGKKKTKTSENASNDEVEKTKSSSEKIQNYGKCCTCRFYGKPCRKTNEFVPRKAEHDCYKQK